MCILSFLNKQLVSLRSCSLLLVFVVLSTYASSLLDVHFLNVNNSSQFSQNKTDDGIPFADPYVFFLSTFSVCVATNFHVTASHVWIWKLLSCLIFLSHVQLSQNSCQYIETCVVDRLFIL